MLEQGGVVSGFEHNLGGTHGGLRGEQRGNVARQSNLHSGLGQGFENDVDVGGTAGGESGDGVHVLFIHHDGPSDNVEHGGGQIHVLRIGVCPFGDRRHSATHKAR